ncbi:MAG: GNAT family N-acetyltransferase [Candidatus Pacearchaeota archaeon]|jgi:N-acetylglutamate synthase-like GNAT family acetyltransferase
MKIELKKARKEDARKIYWLKREALIKINSKDYSKKVINLLLEKNSLNEISKKIKEDVIFCLFKNNLLIGTISITSNKIHGLAIRPSHINKGYGKYLINFIEKYAKKKNIKKLIIYPSLTAQKFYEKLGYKKSGKTSTWKYKNKILELNVPIMEKKLKEELKK